MPTSKAWFIASCEYVKNWPYQLDSSKTPSCKGHKESRVTYPKITSAWTSMVCNPHLHLPRLIGLQVFTKSMLYVPNRTNGKSTASTTIRKWLEHDNGKLKWRIKDLNTISFFFNGKCSILLNTYLANIVLYEIVCVTLCHYITYSNKGLISAKGRFDCMLCCRKEVGLVMQALKSLK